MCMSVRLCVVSDDGMCCDDDDDDDDDDDSADSEELSDIDDESVCRCVS